MHYDLTPDQLADYHHRFVTELGVTGHRRMLRDHPGPPGGGGRAVLRAPSGPPQPPGPEPSAASIYTRRPVPQDTSFLVVGERTNANGSKTLPRGHAGGRLGHLRRHGPDQVREGAHVIDVCVDYTGADGVADMTEVASRLATQSSVPLMVDSTEGPVARAALEWLGGRPILNSVNLEEGDAEGTRLDTFLRLAREFGAAVVCTCIDEEGQARTAEWKVRAARAIHDIAVERYGLEPEDLIFDPLALPLSTGMEESRRDGIETIEGIRRIKAELPGVSHHPRPLQRLVRPQPGGPPGAQLGLPPRVRRGRPRRGHRPRLQDPAPARGSTSRPAEVCLDLVYDRRRDGYDPLAELLALFEGASAAGRRRRATTSTGRSSVAWSSGSSTATATAWRPTSTRPWPPATSRWPSSTTSCWPG